MSRESRERYLQWREKEVSGTTSTSKSWQSKQVLTSLPVGKVDLFPMTGARQGEQHK